MSELKSKGTRWRRYQLLEQAALRRDLGHGADAHRIDPRTLDAQAAARGASPSQLWAAFAHLRRAAGTSRPEQRRQER
jgi:hypothetical protein